MSEIDPKKGWSGTSLKSMMDGSLAHGSFNSSEGAKKGSKLNLNGSLVGPYSKVDVSPTQEFAKKGTGATNDFAKISRLADDDSLSVTFNK